MNAKEKAVRTPNETNIPQQPQANPVHVCTFKKTRPAPAQDAILTTTEFLASTEWWNAQIPSRDSKVEGTKYRI